MDLRSSWCGIELASPLVASAGPLAATRDGVMRLEAAGASAVVLPSLFEEEVEAEIAGLAALQGLGSGTIGEAAGGYFPPPSSLPGDGDAPERQLRLLEDASAAVSIPVIASINGVTPGGWLRWARWLAEAGAAGIELNVFDLVADPDQSASDVELRLLDLVAAVREEVHVPVAVKVGPWFTAPAHFCRLLAAAGADGIVLFNRLYQPDIDLDSMQVVPNVVLSSSHEIRLPMAWLAILRDLVPCSLGASGGVETADDVIKLLLVGADVVMTTSSLLRHGPGHLATLRSGLVEWMTAGGYESVQQLRGSMRRSAVPDPSAWSRATYRAELKSWTSAGSS